MNKTRIGCSDFHATLQRRGFLRAGVLATAGLSLPHLLRLQAEGAAPRQRHKSVIILWMRGGPSQHETWDPKMDAPEAYRGAFGATSTNVSGIQICDLLPRCAQIMDKWSIVRGLHHGSNKSSFIFVIYQCLKIIWGTRHRIHGKEIIYLPTGIWNCFISWVIIHY